jgi:hypothetical protein
VIGQLKATADEAAAKEQRQIDRQAEASDPENVMRRMMTDAGNRQGGSKSARVRRGSEEERRRLL